MQPVLRGRRDAGLPLAAEGVRGPGTDGLVALARRASGDEGGARPDGGGTAAADQAPAGDVGGQEITAAVTSDNGSESALTAAARALMSAWLTSS